MKILIVSDTLLEGGAEMFSLRLCRSLVNKGLHATVLSMNAHYENSEMTSGFSDIKIKRIHIPFGRIIEKLDHWLFRLGIDLSIKTAIQKKQIKRFISDYDIIHTNFIRTDFIFSQLKKSAAFKHIITVHGDYSDYYFRKKEERINWLHLNQKVQLLAHNTDQFVVVSDEQEHFFHMTLKCPRIIKIYNGYESTQSTISIELNKNFTMGMMSRGHPLKGWETLITAFKELPDDCDLYLAGESEYLNDLKRQYKEENKIHFLGYCKDAEWFYKKLDLFVLPTLFPYESLPTVIIESLYFGVPVIATDVGEIANMLIDEESGKKAGYLLDKVDDKVSMHQLKDQILYLYNNPSVLSELKITARKAFAKFTMDRCVNSYISLYKRVIDN
jgi:Glycosyltransferase